MVAVLKKFLVPKITNPWNYAHYGKIFEENCIFIGSTKRFTTPSVRGVLSIRFMDRNTDNHESYYKVDNRDVRIARDEYLLINYNQKYEMHIDADEPVDCFNVFFTKDSINDVYFTLKSQKLDLLLDQRSADHIPVLMERLYDRKDRVGDSMLAIKKAATEENHPDLLWLESELSELLAKVFHAHIGMLDECQAISAARSSTRVELYRRLHRGRDYIHSNLSEKISIAAVAHVACLSPYHFHRCFKSLFKMAVHEYARKLRMERSLALLQVGDDSIVSVAHSVGYEHHSSFTRAFKRHFGYSPAQISGAA